jgi:hypothetical protein
MAIPIDAVKIGRVASVFLLPILLPLMVVGAAVSIPYTKIRRRRMARREDRFMESMRISGRVMEWADFVRELDKRSCPLRRPWGEQRPMCEEMAPGGDGR